MNLTMLETLKNALEILNEKTTDVKALSKKFNYYKACLVTACDELGILCRYIEAHPEVMEHNFYSHELWNDLQHSRIPQEVTYSVVVNEELHGDFTVLLTPVNSELNYNFEYEYYCREEKAWHDVKQLVRLGFVIKNTDGELI